MAQQTMVNLEPFVDSTSLARRARGFARARG